MQGLCTKSIKASTSLATAVSPRVGGTTYTLKNYMQPSVLSQFVYL